MVNSSLHILRMFVSRGARVSSLKCIAMAGAIQRADERYICMKALSRTFCWLRYPCSPAVGIKLHSTIIDESAVWYKFVTVVTY